jgi:hypothetical protein
MRRVLKRYKAAGPAPHFLAQADPGQARKLIWTGVKQSGILRRVTAERQDGQAEHPAREHVNDLEQHPAN